MFDDYPFEIFEKISFYLTARQQATCQSVCRSWRKLFMPCQYRHVQIKGKRQFYQFHQTLQSSMLGHYVKRLSIQDVYMACQELESLPFLCPNLVSFAFNGMTGPSSPYSCFLPYCEWKHLRRLTELQDLTVTNYLLSAPTSAFSHLTHLSIRLSTQQLKSTFFANLQRATELVDLSLDSVTLSLADLEVVHSSCPYLQQLTLTNAKLEPMAEGLEGKRSVSQYPFEPAKCMTTFKYQNGDDLHDNYEWLYYIGIKYPYLETLELWCEYSIYAPQRTDISYMEERYGALASIAMHCPRLTSLKLLNVTMNHWVFEAMDHVGTRLSTLSIGDLTDNTIDMLHYLGQSQQNVSDLVVWGWPSLCIQDTLQETVAAISRCSDKLGSLTVSMQFSGIKNSPIPLDLLFAQCSQLSYLKLDCTQPFLDRNDLVCPNLQHFVVENGCFRNDLFDYLATSCPNLKNLEIESCALITVGSCVTIHMPNHRFEHIKLNHICPPSNYHHAKAASDIRFFDVRVADQRQMFELTEYEAYSPSLSFHYEQKHVETVRPTRYICHGDTQQLPNSTFVSITCSSLNELNLNNFWI